MRRAFTLIELLVFLAMVSILATLVFSAVDKTKAKNVGRQFGKVVDKQVDVITVDNITTTYYRVKVSLRENDPVVDVDETTYNTLKVSDKVILDAKDGGLSGKRFYTYVGLQGKTAEK